MRSSLDLSSCFRNNVIVLSVGLSSADDGESVFYDQASIGPIVWVGGLMESLRFNDSATG